ncbi:MAG: ATPase [Afipia sp.]|nr:ATPase [Afipia sp.]
MSPWLPNRIMQSTVLAGLAACALVLWLVLGQPWLGVTLQAAEDGIKITAVDPQGPARAVNVPSPLLAIGTGNSGQSLSLKSGDLIEEPDMIDAYDQTRDFMERQSSLAAILKGPQVVLQLSSGNAVGLTPESRPLRDLPAAFWVQIITGLGSLLIGGWVLAVRPADIAARLLALAGVMIMISAFAAAIYSSRELAIDGGLFRALSALNHIGALGFGMAMIMLFLSYPKKLAPSSWLWGIALVTAAWLAADILRLVPSQTIGSQLPTLLYMLTIVVLIAVQWFINRRDPRARGVLRWIGLSVLVGAGAFVLLVIAPILAESRPIMQQGYAFGFFLVIYAGLALGVSRYRLFDLDEWAFRIMFYAAGIAALMAIDAVLLFVLHFQRDVSLSIALLSVAFIYLPLRDMLWRRLVERRQVENHELFRSIVDISFAKSPSERSERWRDLLRRLFDPLVMKAADEPVDAVSMRNDGLDLMLPVTADTPALVLRYAWQGRRLFSTAHLQLAQELVRLMRYTDENRTAYERGSVEERRRIARDLHDDVGARLLSGLYKTEIGDTRRVLREALADIRTIVGGLSAGPLPLGRIIATLRHETGERLAAAGVELNWPLAISDESQDLLHYQAYRGLISAHREAISNIIRHAQARKADIRIDYAEGHVYNIITDDGIGFDPVAAENDQRGSGLRGMNRRLADLDGSLSIQRLTPGMSITITIPLQPLDATAGRRETTEFTA